MKCSTLDAASNIVLEHVSGDTWVFYNTKSLAFMVLYTKDPKRSLSGRFANLRELELDAAIRLNGDGYKLLRGELVGWAYCDTCQRLEEVDSPHYPKGV